MLRAVHIVCEGRSHRIERGHAGELRQPPYASRLLEQNLAESWLRGSKFQSRNIVTHDCERTAQSWNLQLLIFESSAAELCFRLRNVAAIFGAVAKKSSCEEQASWQAVCLGWGAQKKGATHMRTLIASSGIVAHCSWHRWQWRRRRIRTAQFCLKSSPTAQPNCMYQTMAQCEQAKGSNASAQCIPNSTPPARAARWRHAEVSALAVPSPNPDR